MNSAPQMPSAWIAKKTRISAKAENHDPDAGTEIWGIDSSGVDLPGGKVKEHYSSGTVDMILSNI